MRPYPLLHLPRTGRPCRLDRRSQAMHPGRRTWPLPETRRLRLPATRTFFEQLAFSAERRSPACYTRPARRSARTAADIAEPADGILCFRIRCRHTHPPNLNFILLRPDAAWRLTTASTAKSAPTKTSATPPPNRPPLKPLECHASPAATAFCPRGPASGIAKSAGVPTHATESVRFPPRLLSCCAQEFEADG